MEPFRAALGEYCFDGLLDDVKVVVEPRDDEAWARGADSVLLGELFEPALRPGEAARPSLTVRPAG